MEFPRMVVRVGTAWVLESGTYDLATANNAEHLAELVSAKAPRPDYRRSVFFRSIGLGLEDVALAHALYQLKQEAC